MKPIVERVERQGEESFSCFEWAARTFLCPYHVHPEIEINYIVSSTGHRLVGDSLDEFGPGDLVLLGAGLPHMYYHRAPARAPAKWARSLYIQFKPDCLGRQFFEMPALRGVGEMLRRAQRGLSFPRSTADGAVALMRGTFASTGARRIGYLLELLHMLSEARSARAIASAKFGMPQTTASSRRLALATSYIHQHLFSEVRLAAVARHSHMSPQGFSRFFHAHMGRTFSSYLTELRIGAACQMLIESDRSVAEVCFASGFGNLANFNRHFKALKGLPPRAFRRQLAIGES